MNFVKALVPFFSILVLVVPSLLLMLLNVKKSVRYKQLRFSIEAFAFAISCCALLSHIDKVLSSVFYIPFVKAALTVISPSGKLEYVIALIAAVAVNTLVLFAFLLVKVVTRVGLNKKKMPEDLSALNIVKGAYWRFVNLFYDIERKSGYIRRGMVKVARTLQYAMWTLSALYLLFLLLLQLPIFTAAPWVPYGFMKNCLTALYIWPAVSFVLINEIRWFLSGREEHEKTGEMLFSHAQATTVVDYGELAEVYKKQFPERVAGYVAARAKGQPLNFYNEVKAESLLTEAIAEQIRRREKASLNESYLTCIKNLCDGHNALVDASLFSEFGEYLFLYLNTMLSRGDNIMFLCSNEESVDFVCEYIGEKLKAINNFHPIWNIKPERDASGTARDEADILVVTPQFIFDENFFTGQDKYLDRLATIVIVNSAEAVAQHSLILSLLNHKLVQILCKKAVSCIATKKSIQYICLSEGIPPETRNALMQILDMQHDIYMCDAYQTFDNTHLMLWRYEANTYAQDNLFGGNDARAYWGVSLPLACVALRYGVSGVSIVTRKSGPYKLRVGSIKNQYSRLGSYFDAGSPIDFDRAVIFNRFDRSNKYASFIIVNDELYNLPLAIYNYCRFGGKDTTMIHIISKPYMLRDYFYAHAEKYIGSEASVNMIMPALADTRQLLIVKLMNELAEKGISEDEFLARVREFVPKAENIDAACAYFQSVIYPDATCDDIHYYFTFEKRESFDGDTLDFKQKYFVRLKKNTTVNRIIRNAKQAKIKIRKSIHKLDVLGDRLYQHHLPGQNMVYNGAIYKIESINADEGIISAVEASDRLDSPTEFTQDRTYLLDTEHMHRVKWMPAEFDSIDIEKLTLKGYEATLYSGARVCVETHGYYTVETLGKQIDFTGKPVYRLLDGDVCSAAKREYACADVLSLKFKGAFSGTSDKAAFLLSVIMNELMKTIFPYSYSCVAVCPVLAEPGGVLTDSFGEKLSKAYPKVVINGDYAHAADDIEVLIFEDSISDLGVIKTMLQDEQNPFKMIFDITLEYLRWFMSVADSTAPNAGKYLFFGKASCPECFDFSTLTKVLEELETVKRSDAIKVDIVTSKGQCSYCHRDLFAVEYRELNDNAGNNNRKMCAACSKIIVSDEAQLRKLYHQTRAYLCGTFGIQLSADINVRFASAEEFRRRLKTGDRRVVSGFANTSSRELWVESDAPAANVLETLSHELTHFWQFENVDTSDRVYMEGHTSFVEVQYMRHLNRNRFADWQEAALEARQDEYGEGFRRIKAELKARGNDNSFSYIYELFGEGGGGRAGGSDPGLGLPGYEPAGEEPLETDSADMPLNSLDGEINRDPNRDLRYAFTLLNDEEKAAYDIIYQAVTAFAPEAAGFADAFTSEQAFKVIDYIRRDHPEIFWLGADTTASTLGDPGAVVKVNLAYCMTASAAAARQKKIDEAIKPFLASIHDKMSDYEAVLRVYENIIGLIDYDTVGLGEQIADADVKSKPDDLRSIYGAFIKRKAVCAGYTMATQYLLNRLGIECTYVRGKTSKDGYHAWNLLWLEGEPYYLDTTWGDASDTDAVKNTTDLVNYDYFCITTEELLRDHTPDADYPVPMCTAVKYNYHHKSGLYFTAYDWKRIRTLTCRFIKIGEKHISFKCATKNVYDELIDQLVEKNKFSDILKYARMRNDKTLDTSYTYYKDREMLTVVFEFKRR